MKKMFIFLLLVAFTSNAIAQVSKTNSSMACVSNSSADRSVTYTAADFGGCTSVADVNITINYRITDNSSGNPGAFGVHEDVDFKLISPTGTIVPLMQHNRSAPMGCGTLVACGSGGACEASFVGSFAYVDGTVTIDQSAATPINRWNGSACATSEAPVTGTYQPHEGRNLDVFNGENPVGTWTLRITDPFDNFGEWNCLMSYTITVTCGSACTDPTVPTVTYTPTAVCSGNNTTLNISGTLNDATQWNVYSGSCGGTLIGSTSGSTFVVNPVATTTYFIRGEGGCVTPGSCSSVTVTVDNTDYDSDGLCNSVDTDDDGDGVLDVNDTDPLNEWVCQDLDGDGCDDCSQTGMNNTPDPSNDGLDTDGDGICDSGDTDDDNDGVVDASDVAPLNPDICGDADGDGCDDCSVGTDDFGPLADNLQNNDGTDTDGDGICDAGDADDDNDGVVDAMDTDPTNPFICQDADADGCDDCAIGTDGYGPLSDVDSSNDGPDVDGDGLCDSGDTDDDNDGISDTDEVNIHGTDPLDDDSDDDGIMDGTEVNVYGTDPMLFDTDADGLSDGLELGLASPEGNDTDMGVFIADSDVVTTTNPLSMDTDSDGLTDGNEDVNANGQVDATETDPNNADTDNGGIDDGTEVSNGTDPLNPADDIPCTDYDNDGICDNLDTDDDGDGVLDVDDTDPLNEWVCQDLDNDGCDDCSQTGMMGTPNTNNDGQDTDGDGICDLGDDDDDNDGVLDATDVDPLNPDLCGDADGDGCDDCSVGTDDFGPLADNLPNNDGVDTDGDGLCDSGDDDDDNDGCLDVDDSNPLVATADSDGDGIGDDCDVCTGDDASGDSDGDGICDDIDTCPNDPNNDADGDGVCDDIDNCVGTANPTQLDTDNDGIGDDCDVCPNDAGNDADGDGFCADVDCDDNNPNVYPGNTEILCNGIDDDCNPATLDDTNDPTASNLAPMTVECVADIPAPNPADVTDAADDCSVPTVTHVSDVSDGLSCPETITRTYNVADFSGNNINVTQEFTVLDVTAPTASNPLSLSVQCVADVPAPNTSWVTDEADNCGAPVVAWVSDVSDGNSCPETISRTFSVTDDCGNSISVVQLIVVNDLNAPIADATSLPTETAYCDVTLTAPTATDNCSGVVTGTTATVFPINTVGTTTVTWTFTDDCGNTSTQTQNVVIEEMETGTWIANDGLTIVSSNLETGVTYQWIDCLNGDQPIVGQTNHNFTPTTTGEYAVVTTIAGCSDTSDCVSAVAGIDEVLNAKLNVYPNPTNGAITVEFEGEVNTIEIIDLTGRIVFVSNKVNTEIEPGVEPGEYMVVIKTDAGTAVQKLVVL